MDEAAMAELLAPIAQLGANVANMEVKEEDADAVIKELLSGIVASSDDPVTTSRQEHDEKSEARAAASAALRHSNIAAGLSRGRRQLDYYERALEGFGQALDGGGVPESAVEKVVSSMKFFLDEARACRCSLADPSIKDAADGVKTRAVLLAMAKRGFPLLARGVAARSEASQIDAETDGWRRFVLLSEAADCLVAYLKGLPKAPPEVVTRATTEVLAELETLGPRFRAEEQQPEEEKSEDAPPSA